jgi:hypothetical protein
MENIYSFTYIQVLEYIECQLINECSSIVRIIVMVVNRLVFFFNMNHYQKYMENIYSFTYIQVLEYIECQLINECSSIIRIIVYHICRPNHFSFCSLVQLHSSEC